MNKAILTGYIGKIDEKENFIKFSFATSKKVKGEDIVQWHNCIAFGNTMEFIKKYVTRGCKLMVYGEITYTNKDKVKYTNIVVENIEVLTWKKSDDKLSTPEKVIEGIEENYMSGFINDDFPF